MVKKSKVAVTLSYERMIDICQAANFTFT